MAKKFATQLCIGGTSTKIDVENISKLGANILIATPGKLKELMEIKDSNNEFIINFKQFEILIMGIIYLTH